jgi:hypothetical protein
MVEPPANACAHNGAPRAQGGARPIAICATRAATADGVLWVAPLAAPAAWAQRRNVAHPVAAAEGIRQAHTWVRTSHAVLPTSPHSANAIEIAACP